MSQAQAILFGLALGDALGAPVEFMKINGSEGIKSRYGEAGIQDPPDPALYTDDTQMTIALTEGLLDAGLDAPIDEQMQAVGARFVEWANSPENNRAPGRTCMTAVGRFESGVPWRESGVAHSKGCGSAMRVATLGYLYQYDPQKLREVAHYSSIITHGHPAAVAGSVAAAYLVRLALEGVPVREYVSRTLAFVQDHQVSHRDGWLDDYQQSDDFMQAFRKLGHVLAWGSEERALKHIGEGWVAEEAVALAMYCVLRYSDDFVAAVRRGASTDGDSDSIASIAGGIMGARLGLESIPADWIKRCEKRDYLIDLAQRMESARAALLQRRAQ